MSIIGCRPAPVQTMEELCECCKARPATDRHHCLVHRSKRMPELDHRFNIEDVCRECHNSGIVNGYKHRVEFFARQKARYGQAFLDWWDKLPMKVKPRYE